MRSIRPPATICPNYVQRRGCQSCDLGSAEAPVLWEGKNAAVQLKNRKTSAPVYCIRRDPGLVLTLGKRGVAIRPGRGSVVGRGSHAFSRLAAGRRLPKAPLSCDACSQHRRGLYLPRPGYGIVAFSHPTQHSPYYTLTRCRIVLLR